MFDINPAQQYQRLRYSPLLSQLVVTRRCNLTCGYCFEFDQHSEPVPSEELKKRIDRLHELGSFALELTGGEPLLHPRIIELVRYAKTKPWKMLGMISNAYLLSDEIIDGLNEAGLTDLQVSVDGVEPNATTVKVLRPLRPKLERLAKRARFRVTLSAVVGASALAAEVEEVITYAKTHGFRPRILLIHGSDGQLALAEENLRAYRRAQQMIGFHYQDIFDYRENLIKTGLAPFRCRAGSRYLYVDEQGIVHWCSQTRAQFGKPLADYTFADLREQFYKYKPCHASCTIGCARSCSMLDRWFAQDSR